MSIAVILGTHFELSRSLAADIIDLPQPTLLSETYTAAPLAESGAATTSVADATTTEIAADIPAQTALEQKRVTRVAEPRAKKPSIAQAAPKTVAAADEAGATQETPTLGTALQYPVRLIIPSIDLDAPIVPVGVNAKGEMDVPNGSTNEIGWYKGGTMPGNRGSAVLDAHVFAALKDLKYVKLGAPIYVETKGGTRLKFVLKESLIYELSDLTSDMLFGKNDARRLNIITCAGTYVPSIGTYDHRLVDYAIFESEEL